jgi:hypothetical protein
MGTGEDRQKLEQVEAIIQPDDPANIQYTSVSQLQQWSLSFK